MHLIPSSSDQNCKRNKQKWHHAAFSPLALIIKCNPGVKTDWGASSCGVRGAKRGGEKKKGLDFKFHRRQKPGAGQTWAPSPDTDAECTFRELTTAATFRNDTSRCHLRGRAHRNRSSQMVPTSVFPFNQSVHASTSRDPACYFWSGPAFTHGPAPSASSSIHRDRRTSLEPASSSFFIVMLS